MLECEQIVVQFLNEIFSQVCNISDINAKKNGMTVCKHKNMKKHVLLKTHLWHCFEQFDQLP